MNISTALNVAKFAYSTFEFVNAKESQNLEPILAYLKEINTKLDVINDKLDKLFTEIDILPNKIEYTKNISTLNAVLEDLKPFSNTLRELKATYGEAEGKEKFITSYKSTLNDYLNLIHLTFQKLENYHDPLVTTYICACVKVDLELSILLSTDRIGIKERMRDYLDYFDKSSLSKLTENFRESIENWRRLESLLNRTLSAGDAFTQVLNLPPIPKDKSGVYFYELDPLPIALSELNEDQHKLVSFLLEKKLLKENELKIRINYKRSYLGVRGGYVNVHAERPAFVSLMKQGYLRPGPEGLISHGFSEGEKQTRFKDLYNIKIKTVNIEYMDHFEKLLSYLSAMNTATSTKILINQAISNYSK